MLFSKKRWYLIHRWVALIVSLQLLAWSVGGMMFSLLDIENVRGNIDRRQDPRAVLRLQEVDHTPSEAATAAREAGADTSALSRIVLRSRQGRQRYELFDVNNQPICVVDALGGRVTLEISEEEARQAAIADFTEPVTVRSVQRLVGEPPSEYRGGSMPVYQVIVDHPKEPRLYVDPVTGVVLKRRNSVWRLFDFFWMLHIMDYGGRDNFNHPLLTGMSILAVVTSASGLILWWWRIPRKRKSQAEKTAVGACREASSE